MKYTEEYKSLVSDAAPHLIDYLSCMEVLQSESDRGAVLVTASMLDDILKQLLLARLLDGDHSKKLFAGPNAPLGTFSSRIIAARAVGVISEQWKKELNLLRKIRNDFAHSVSASLEDVSTLDKCNALTLCTDEVATTAEGARTKYWMSATAIILNSLNYLQEGRISKLRSLQD